MTQPVEDTEITEDSPENILDVSDDDFLKMDIHDSTETIQEDSNIGTEQADEEGGDVEEPVEDTSAEKEEEEPVEEASSVPEPEKDDDPVDSTEEVETKEPEPAIDYEAEYKKVMAPFKANGREMTAKNADDAVTLMQMGVNYHKKMAGLKPSLKTLKLLEKNDLLDPDKLNYLIDLNNKNPEAISKLLKDSGIDPLDVDVSSESTYKPTNRSVSDTEMDLDEVLESIKDTPTYSKTLNVMTKEWDDASKNAAANQPHIISIINGHIESGIYDTVMDTVNYEKSLGNLQNLSDFEAYKQVGDALHAAGKLNVPAKANTPVTPPVKPSPSKDEIKRRERKKAASPTKTVATPPVKPFNPLDLSDEEFEKFDPKRFVKK